MQGFFEELDRFLGRGVSLAKSIARGQAPSGERESEAEKNAPLALEKQPKRRSKKKRRFEVLPVHVSGFDSLLEDNGLERGSTILISGGAGTGKTTFCIQSLYHGALKGEKGVFISFEEPPEKIRLHMKKNYGWDLEKMEKRGLLALVKFDPGIIARKVEEMIAKKTGTLKIEVRKLQLPIEPDRIAVDSLSALSIAFEEEENYRKYLRELFELLDAYNSVNLVISETEQDPKVYSRTGVEEFLADGLVVLYNMKRNGKRAKALEILKMRSGNHLQEMAPYSIGKNGIDVSPPKKKQG